MTVVVESSTDQVAAALNGGVFPIPADVAADNAARAARVEEPIKGVPITPEKPEPKEPAKPDPDDEEGEDGLTPRQKKEFTASMQKTIAKKHRMQKEAEELAANEYNRGQLAEQRAQQLAQENAQLKERLKPATPVVEEAKAPKRDDFETDEAYEDARVDYRVDQKLKTQHAQEETRRQEQHKQEVLQHAAARIERAIELVPDFKEVTEAQDVQVPEFIAGYMQESDMFAEIGYHFAKNPDILKKLTEFTANIRPGTPEFTKAVTRQLVELGKIESTLTPFSKEKVNSGEEEPRPNGTKPSTETGTAPSKPRIQAPIIRPLNGGSAAQVEKDEGEMKSSEVITAWQRKHGVKLTARKRH